jgi:hypothetical protein
LHTFFGGGGDQGLRSTDSGKISDVKHFVNVPLTLLEM